MTQINISQIKKVLKLVANDVKESTIDNLLTEETLLEKLQIDSLKFIELVVELEQEFNVEISDEYLIAENFESISRIEELLVEINDKQILKG
ncbi:phosphopantetheine-binding protein [Lysinibacillus sp. RSDA_15]|uniref:phosphopantetheine-binding protein n=1 Tax=Lysinibacillus TaxID=400634 RepID=UPI0018CD238D|nr:phosphopantetheine-binding protein [Lysinibacillus sphaericus]MBG9754198.1 hypothetical protein [Lysinibacillus sphaericus]QTB15739.1 hypothetical protein J2B92_11470 [Lysinibacillus sphaericus]